MKAPSYIYIISLVIFIITAGSNCSEQEHEINYDTGFFPEETYNIEGINSSYDDFNIALPQFAGELPLMFSSNRDSQGEQFDIVSGIIYFIFSQIDAEFTLNSNMINDAFYDNIEQKVNSPADELGPYRFFNGAEGMEYFFYAGEDEGSVLNIKYLRYSPAGTGKAAELNEAAPVSSLNSDSNDAYICFNKDISAAYFTSDRYGSFDIVSAGIDDPALLGSWLEGSPVSISPVDSINSEYDDKCPFIRQDIMMFASNRPGGMGAYDLYYSVYRNGKWSSPQNMGPEINTEYNEYRPVAGNYPNFSNSFLLFSSDRPSGQGGYDLYLRGIDLTLLSE